MQNQGAITIANLDDFVVKRFPHDGALDVKTIFADNSPYVARVNESRQIGEAIALHETPTMYVICKTPAGVMRKKAGANADTVNYVRACRDAMQ